MLFLDGGDQVSDTLFRRRGYQRAPGICQTSSVCEEGIMTHKSAFFSNPPFTLSLEARSIKSGSIACADPTRTAKKESFLPGVKNQQGAIPTEMAIHL